MKTLTEIQKEVGARQYRHWEIQAENELGAHPEFWERASAYRAFMYEAIHKLYWRQVCAVDRVRLMQEIADEEDRPRRKKMGVLQL